MSKVIVVGGGFAGVAATTALAEKGFQVELLESRGTLGGRVYSTIATDNFPAPVDNGPHLFMGCYRETLRLFQRLEVPDPFRWIDPTEGVWNLQALEKSQSFPVTAHEKVGSVVDRSGKIISSYSRINPATQGSPRFQ